MATTTDSVSIKTAVASKKPVQVSSCEVSWSKFVIGGVETCLKANGKGFISDAASACKSIGAKLPLPTNNQENSDLGFAITSLGLTGAALDCTRLKNRHKWRDSDSNSCTYFLWQPGQPNAQINKDAYLAIEMKKKGEWNDYWGDTSENYVCQKAI